MPPVGFQGALERDAVVVIVIVLDARHHDSAHLHVLRHGVVAVSGQFPQIGDREIPLGRRRSLHEGQLLHDRGIPFGRNAYRQRTGAGSIVFGNGHRHGRHARGLGLREFGPRGVVARDGDRPVASWPRRRTRASWRTTARESRACSALPAASAAPRRPCTLRPRAAARRPPAARKKLFKSLFFIIAYFLRSTSTGRWSETVITLISSYEGTAVRSTSYDGELPV